jgi:MoxR-like ATPase
MTQLIDSALQKKYRQTVDAVFGINNKKQAYFISPSETFVTDIATAFLLKDSAILLTGSPGVGKTTLLRILAYQLTGDRDSLGVVNCTQDLRAEDFVYEVAIEYHERNRKETIPEEGAVTAIEFQPKPRPILTRKFALLNEINRLNSRSMNALLSILAERSIVVHGTELRRATGIVLMDMNPHVAGPMEWAFVDRLRANIHVPALLDLGDQLRLLKAKYGKGKHIEDLVAHAMNEPAPMTTAELVRVWEDVDRVTIDDDAFSSLILFTSVFSSCKHDLSTRWVSFELPCDKCEFKETCITTHLEHPVFTRSLDHLVKMLKAGAYYAGRNQVNLRQDILPALRRVMLHRLQVKPEYASKYVDAQAWYDAEVEQRILELQENWKQSKTSYDEIAKVLKENRDMDASRLFNAFRKHAKDIVSLKIVEMLEPSIEAAAEDRFKKAYAKCLAYEKIGYSRTALDEFASLREELPPRYAEQLSKLRDKLLTRLDGMIEVKVETYSDFVVAIAKVDSAASDMATELPQWGRKHYTLSDGTTIEVSAERGRYIVQFNAQTSVIADTIRGFSG